MLKIVIHGAFDADNFGDVLLADLTTQHINSLGCKVLVSGTTEEIVTQIQGDCERLSSLGQALNAKGLIYSGGGYWGEPPNSRLNWHLSRGKKHLGIGYLFKLTGRRFICVGTGYGPLSYKISRWATTFLLRSAKTLALRDEESMNFFLAYGGKNSCRFVTADMALVIDKEKIKENLKSGLALSIFPPGTIGIHANEPLSSTRQIGFLEEVRDAAAAHPDRKFVVFQDGGHRNEARRADVDELAKFIGQNCTPVYYENPWVMCHNLSQMSIVLTNKLHVGIVSSALGKIVIAIPNHPKTHRFYRQIGRPDCCIDPLKRELGDIKSAIFRAIAGDIPPIEVPKEIRSESQRNYDLISEFVAGIR